MGDNQVTIGDEGVQEVDARGAISGDMGQVSSSSPCAIGSAEAELGLVCAAVADEFFCDVNGDATSS